MTGTWVAIARTSGAIATSSNGTTWTVIGSGPPNYRWSWVCYGGDVFVMTANYGQPGFDYAATSYDGVTWTVRSLPTSSSGYWGALAYGNGTFVVSAEDSGNCVATSPDGAVWTMRSGAANTWLSIIWANSQFVALQYYSGSHVFTSPDGITWTSRSSVSGSGTWWWYRLAYGNGVYVAIGDNYLAEYSSDAISWYGTSMPSAMSWQSLAFGNGVFVALGMPIVSNTFMPTSSYATTTNGSSWTARTMPSSQLWYGIYYGNGLFVALAQGQTYATSSDGITWTQRSMPTSDVWSLVTYATLAPPAKASIALVATTTLSAGGTFAWTKTSTDCVVTATRTAIGTAAASVVSTVLTGTVSLIAAGHVALSSASAVTSVTVACTVGDAVAWTSLSTAMLATATRTSGGLAIVASGATGGMVVATLTAVATMSATEALTAFPAIATLSAAGIPLNNGLPLRQDVGPSNPTVITAGLSVIGTIIYSGMVSGLTAVVATLSAAGVMGILSASTDVVPVAVTTVSGGLSWTSASGLTAVTVTLPIASITTSDPVGPAVTVTLTAGGIITGTAQEPVVAALTAAGVAASYSSSIVLDVTANRPVVAGTAWSGASTTSVVEASCPASGLQFTYGQPVTTLIITGTLTAGGVLGLRAVSTASSITGTLSAGGWAAGSTVSLTLVVTGIVGGTTTVSMASVPLPATVSRTVIAMMAASSGSDSVVTGTVTANGETVGAVACPWIASLSVAGVLTGWVSTSEPLSVTSAPLALGWTSDGIIRVAVGLPAVGSLISLGATFITIAADSPSGTAAASSPDGITWTRQVITSSPSWYAVAAGNGRVIAVAAGDDLASVSPDGVVWTSGTLPSEQAWHSIAYGNGRFVALGHGSSVAATTVDGFTWVARTLPSVQNWHAVTYAWGQFVALAFNSNVSAVSSDGVTWVQCALPSVQGWHSIAYGNGRYLAVAQNSAVAAISEDGVTWTAQTMPSSQYWYSVAYGAGVFVALAWGLDSAAVSQDGVTWTTVPLPSTGAWRAVTYSAGVFVAVCQGSTMSAVSHDGMAWIPHTLPSAVNWNAIAALPIAPYGGFSGFDVATVSVLTLTAGGHLTGLVSGSVSIRPVVTLSTVSAGRAFYVDPGESVAATVALRVAGTSIGSTDVFVACVSLDGYGQTITQIMTDNVVRLLADGVADYSTVAQSSSDTAVRITLSAFGSVVYETGGIRSSAMVKLVVSGFRWPVRALQVKARAVGPSVETLLLRDQEDTYIGVTLTEWTKQDISYSTVSLGLGSATDPGAFSPPDIDKSTIGSNIRVVYLLVDPATAPGQYHRWVSVIDNPEKLYIRVPGVVTVC